MGYNMIKTYSICPICKMLIFNGKEIHDDCSLAILDYPDVKQFIDDCENDRLNFYNPPTKE